MATYVVGDLQGCYRELQQLLATVKFDPANDVLWLTGDLVNRGPQSLECLRLVRSLGKSAVTVLGNHDLHLLAVAMSGASSKKKDTLADILSAPDRDELMHWLRQQPLMVVDEARKLALVHAGIFPDWTIPQARQLAKEVETVLQSDSCLHFLQHMYGNEPDNWGEDLRGVDRLRFITNAFTRMRICAVSKKPAKNNALELRYKEGVDGIPSGYVPWFSRFLPPDGWRILFGHWAALETHTGIDNIIALDSGCIWGRFLTMLRIDDSMYFHSS
ncbi:MAG: symmetrical bis(5'-nucleosyl)-tetraphosphatase [Cellvibrionales bacterium]|nr:symmetrical bis(5'-nucleosyl)-tetraphosphatase [Cellvibrionales bacterium]